MQMQLRESDPHVHAGQQDNPQTPRPDHTHTHTQTDTQTQTQTQTDRQTDTGTRICIKTHDAVQESQTTNKLPVKTEGLEVLRVPDSHTSQCVCLRQRWALSRELEHRERCSRT